MGEGWKEDGRGVGEEGFEDATVANRSDAQKESRQEHEGHTCCCYICFVPSRASRVDNWDASAASEVKKCEAFPSQGCKTGGKDEHEPVTKSCDKLDNVQLC